MYRGGKFAAASSKLFQWRIAKTRISQPDADVYIGFFMS
jgi:hypothetical protein